MRNAIRILPYFFPKPNFTISIRRTETHLSSPGTPDVPAGLCHQASLVCLVPECPRTRRVACYSAIPSFQPGIYICPSSETVLKCPVIHVLQEGRIVTDWMIDWLIDWLSHSLTHSLNYWQVDLFCCFFGCWTTYFELCKLRHETFTADQNNKSPAFQVLLYFHYRGEI